jgi:hypothetical protein
MNDPEAEAFIITAGYKIQKEYKITRSSGSREPESLQLAIIITYYQLYHLNPTSPRPAPVKEWDRPDIE